MEGQRILDAGFAKVAAQLGFDVLVDQHAGRVVIADIDDLDLLIRILDFGGDLLGGFVGSVSDVNPPLGYSETPRSWQSACTTAAIDRLSHPDRDIGFGRMPASAR